MRKDKHFHSQKSRKPGKCWYVTFSLALFHRSPMWWFLKLTGANYRRPRSSNTVHTRCFVSKGQRYYGDAVENRDQISDFCTPAKLFQTSNIDIVQCCQSHFCFDLPSVVYDRRARKFDPRYKDHSNPFCRMISHLWMLWVWYFFFLFSYCRYCRCSYLYLVKLLPPLSDVFSFFVVVLPVMVNKDE